MQRGIPPPLVHYQGGAIDLTFPPEIEGVGRQRLAALFNACVGKKHLQSARSGCTRARRALEGERSETVVPEAVDWTYKKKCRLHR